MLGIEFLPLVLGRVATLPMESLLLFSTARVGGMLDEVVALEARLEQARGPLASALHALVPKIEQKPWRHALLEGRRRLRQAYPFLAWPHEKAFEDAIGNGALAQLHAWNELAGARADLLAQAQQLLEGAELARLREELARLLADPFFEESLFLSSPALLDAAKRYRKAPPAGQASKSHRKTERALIEHLARVCAKTTPRSILTAVHVGRLNPRLPGSLGLTQPPAPGRVSSRKSLLVLPIVRDMARAASQEGRAWRHVVPRANPTLRREPGTGKLVFWQRVGGPEKEVLYRLTASAVLDELLALTRARRHNAQQLLELLSQRFPQFGLGELEAYYKKLCEQGLLIGHFEIPVEDPDGLACLIGWIRSLPEEDRPAQALQQALDIGGLLARIDDLSASFEARGAAYAELARAVSAQRAHTVTPDRVVMVDSASKWRGLELGAEVTGDLEKFLAATARLAQPISAARQIESDLAQHFESKFPGRSSVDVLETYAPSASQEPPWKGQTRRSVRDWPQNEGWRSRLLRLKDILQAKERQAAAPPRDARLDVDDFPGAAADGFFTGYLRFHIAAPSSPREKRLLVLEGIYPFLAGGFARWGYLFADERGVDPIHASLSDFWRDHVAKHWPGKTAGICFQAGTRKGLVNSHPTPQPYVVEWQGARSSRPAEFQLSLDDLYFSIDPKSGVVVRSKSDPSTAIFAMYDRLLGAREEPMIELMTVLCASRHMALSLRSEPLLSDELGGLPGHIPRLVLENVVLARETWATRASFFHPWNDLSPAAFFIELNRWRGRLGIPRFVFAHSCASQKLERPQPIDFWNPFLTDSLQSFFRTLSPETEVWIIEMLPRPDELALGDDSGHYAQEVVLGFALESKGEDGSSAR